MTETIPQRPAPQPAEKDETAAADKSSDAEASPDRREIGGRKGPDPTRYGDWEKNGRCIDF